jgi:hypothetical protein
MFLANFRRSAFGPGLVALPVEEAPTVLAANPPCHADVRQLVDQGILFLDGPEESASA